MSKESKLSDQAKKVIGVVIMKVLLEEGDLDELLSRLILVESDIEGYSDIYGAPSSFELPKEQE